MKKIKVIYLRVSKKELNENTQLPVILKAFELDKKECLILQERISGYKEKAQIKRKELNKLLELIEEDRIESIYVYSLERLYRNIYWLLEFYFKCQKNGIEIYSYLQPEITKIKGNKPIDTFLKLISVLTNGFMGMQESYLTSERTKKSFSKDEDGNTISYKGNRVGRKTDITEKDKTLIMEMSRLLSYREIKKEMKKRYNKDISLSYISSIVNKEK